MKTLRVFFILCLCLRVQAAFNCVFSPYSNDGMAPAWVCIIEGSGDGGSTWSSYGFGNAGSTFFVTFSTTPALVRAKVYRTGGPEFAVYSSTVSVAGAYGPFDYVTVTGSQSTFWQSGPISITTSGTAWAPPVTYPKSAWGQTVTNTEGFVVRYRFRIDYETGTDFEEIFAVQPGETRTLSVENAVGFTPTIDVERVLPDGLGTVWVASTGLNAVTTTTESSATTPTNTGSTAAGNIWNSTTAPTTLGTQTPIAATTQTRDDVSSATSDALQRLREANDEKRHTELKSLLVAADNAEAKRDTVALESSIAGLSAIRAQVAASGAGIVASMEAGKNNAPSTYGTSAAITGAQSGAGAAAGSLGGLIPSVSVPTGTAPTITLPFSELHESLEDSTWDFGSDELQPFVEALRAVELVGVTVFFLFVSVKLLGRFSNV